LRADAAPGHRDGITGPGCGTSYLKIRSGKPAVT
jgi:hypothetical protein